MNSRLGSSTNDSGTPSSPNQKPNETGILRRLIAYLYQDRLFWIAVAIVFVLRLFPEAYWLGWPFSQFGTYVHELFHGLAAMASGAKFVEMTVHPEGGGVAYSLSYNTFQRAMTAAGGLIGPSILGAIMLVSARRFGITNLLFGFLSFLFLIVAFLWAEGGYTVALSLGFAALCFVIAIIPFQAATRLLSMFIAIQLGFENLIDIDYMFTAGFERDGEHFKSDTGKIAQLLGGAYWFWGGLIALFTLTIITAALYLSAPKFEESAD